MFLAPDANFVVCPGENALLDASGGAWVKNRALAGVFTRAKAIELSLSVEWPYGHRFVTIAPTNVCACCGKHPHQANLALVEPGPPKQWRCEQHIGRNPCAIEGCGRTREGNRPALTSWLCGAHWRRVSARSKLVYKRIWRLQKKSGGWTDILNHRYWRIWGAIILEAQRNARGDVDMKAVSELFGWDE